MLGEPKASLRTCKSKFHFSHLENMSNEGKGNIKVKFIILRRKLRLIECR